MGDISIQKIKKRASFPVKMDKSQPVLLVPETYIDQNIRIEGIIGKVNKKNDGDLNYVDVGKMSVSGNIPLEKQVTTDDRSPCYV